MHSPSAIQPASVTGPAIRCTQLMIVAVLSVLGLLSRALHADPQVLIGPLCWSIVALFLWSVWSWCQVTRSLFDWYVIFLTAAFVFNGGHAFLEVLHLNERGVLDSEFSSETVMQTLYMVELSLAALHCGALAGIGRSWLHEDNAGPEPTPPETKTSMRLVGGGLLLIALPFTAMLLKDAVEIVLSGGYVALYQQKAPTGLGAGPKLLATFLIPGVMFLLSGSGESRAARWILVGVVLAYAAINFFLGVRHEAALLMLALAWLWYRQIRPFSMTLLLTGAATAVLVVFPLVAATREDSGSDRISFSHLVDMYTTLENPAIAAVHEMGGSMMTVAHTINLVPSTREFEWGAGYGYALLTLFPNLFWDIHPTIARKIPSDWLIWQVDPYIAEQGGGLGYSFIAEAYLNFGWLGLPFVMILGGYVGSRVVLWTDRSRRADRAAMTAAAACFLVFYVRAELAVVLRGVLWFACLPYCAVLILNHTQSALGHCRSAWKWQPGFQVDASNPKVPTLTGDFR